jgi:hypothetical protein
MGTMKWMTGLVLFFLPLAGCELRGLTRGQLYGSEAADAAVEADTSAADVAAVPDASAPPDVAASPDAAAPDGPAAPPGGIFVTGFIHGVCDSRQVMVGGAGYHTCSYAGKGSYRLRIRDVPPGTRVEIGAKAEGYLPSPDTATIILQLDGNTHDFTLKPATGSCDTVPDAGPCICNAPACEPS